MDWMGELILMEIRITVMFAPALLVVVLFWRVYSTYIVM